MKYLIAGLGNFSKEYFNTRHNIGFRIADVLACEAGAEFEDKRYAYRSTFRFKGKVFILIKPTTFMNLSGKAINYWLQKENITVENLLVISDDFSLPFGKLRLRPGGSDAGHNGLKHITEILGHDNYPRLRFGIGNEFMKGTQTDYVLGEWSSEEVLNLADCIQKATEIVKSFGVSGIQLTMNRFNNK